MKYRVLVLENVSFETPKGLVTAKQGWKIKLTKDEAIPIIKAGLITLIEKVAYKVYSESLGRYLWIVEKPEHKTGLREQNITEAIYTFQETKLLEGMDRELLNAVQQVKEIFEDSEVIECISIPREIELSRYGIAKG